MTARKNRSYRATPEQLDLLLDLLPSARSFRDIAAILGVRLEWVRQHARPFLEIMTLNGTHPICSCGKPRFHQYICSENAGPGAQGHRRGAELAEERKATVIPLIMSGMVYADIEEAFGMAPHTARHYLRYMSDQQRQERKSAEERRTNRTKRRARSATPDAAIDEQRTARVEWKEAA